MLRVLPLGGLGEIGMNTMMLEHSGERVLIDCGLMFPRPDELGAEIVVPDYSVLLNQPEALKGVLLTHAHEDHLGALPVLLRQLNVPVYGTRFTLALARHKLEEAGLQADLRVFEPRQRVSIGEFDVEPVRVTHSVPDAVGLVVRTASATVVHTGDFKLDDTPTDGLKTDLERLGEVGERGVNLLLSDSTNAEVNGHSRSESRVQAAFERLVSQAKGRVAIAMFGSHLHRVQHSLALAAKVGRKVVLLGRSLQRNVALAIDAGLLASPGELLVEPDAARQLSPERVLILSTGAQAEVRSGLSNLVSAEPGPLRLQAGDTAIISARTIPGNEPAVSVLVDRLLSLGITVITASQEPDVHVSGHAGRDEQRTMIDTVRPKHFVPIHGERRHLMRHLEIAKDAGLHDSQTSLLVDGHGLAIDVDHVHEVPPLQVGRRLMRREGLGEITPETLAERRYLAEGGLVAVVVVLKHGSGDLAVPPTAHGQGLQSDERAVLSMVADEVRQALGDVPPALRSDDAKMREEVIRVTRRVFRQLLGARPTVLPLVVRV